MFIDALLEWENIFSGKYSDEQISNRRHKLMKLQHDAERKFKSLVIPPVTVRIPMPAGAGIPAPSQTPAQAPSQTRPAK
jgi:hypothetical protein